MRNRSLDAVKAIAACLVVFIHVSFPGQTGQIIKVFARNAVPFFFMVSGYFCYYEKKNAAEQIPAKICHILKLSAVSLGFYFVWEGFMKCLSGEDLWQWFGKLTAPEHLKELLVYNSTSVVRAHLWFLPALLYCYILDFFIEKRRLRKAVYCCIPVLLAALMWRAEFCRIFGGFYHTMEYRNFLFTGMSFYLTGQMIHEYQDKKMQKMSEKRYAGQFGLVTGIAAGAVLSILEYCLLGPGEIYAGNCITVICLFIWLILYGKNIKFPDVIAEVGQKYAFLIYLLHPAVADAVKIFSKYPGISGNGVYLWLRPLIVYLITLSLCLLKTVHRRKNVV